MLKLERLTFDTPDEIRHVPGPLTRPKRSAEPQTNGLLKVRGFALAVALSGLASGLALLFYGFFKPMPFVPFFPAIVVVAFYGGFGPGLHPDRTGSMERVMGSKNFACGEPHALRTGNGRSA